MKQVQEGPEAPGARAPADGAYRARIAFYDPAARRSRYQDLRGEDLATFVVDLCGILDKSFPGGLGGGILDAVAEVAENLIHTTQRSMAVLAVSGEKLQLVFSDNGPGIADKERALQPGYTTASEDMRRRIRGVGLGLFHASEIARAAGGELTVSDNLGGGTVIRIEFPAVRTAVRASSAPPTPRSPREVSPTRRQNDVLFLLTETGEAGPRLVASELKISVSTAHRELLVLEKAGLIGASEAGRRFLTAAGRSYLQNLLSL